MRHALFLPPFGPLAEPGAMVEIAIAAEAHGWDGLFLWDHVVRPVGGEWAIADPWVVLAAVAATTRHIRLGADGDATVAAPDHEAHRPVDEARFCPHAAKTA